ncbi:metal ABC transporter permease [Acidiferrimicrobium sp. IK]|uniref:metal ABC transporter permease n=1 Tax=Acidiferrimicrobium sp. IK TaxID=2871700 RepID=UPI0021CB0233|nr:metal ABC transporter permease [Acidiferrimicrobium sp. IK]MCU4182833.1 metal ABC transporter permease [Acidiferrimicrobium sp. IK]
MTVLGLAVADPFAGVAHMLGHPFEVRAVIAGSLIAAAAALVGWFVVLRSQVFTGDALSHVAFTGALAALAAGIDLRIGLFVGCVVFGLAMAVLGRNGRADDVVIGSVFAWVLGLGVLLLTVYTTGSGATDASAGINVLFGSIFGLSASQSTLAALIAVGVIVVMIAIARPLLFASLDPAVASARGVPVRVLGVVFLALVGVTAGEATQAVGSLLLLGLLSAPAGAAARLTDRPFVAMWVAVGLGVVSVWGGLAISYAASRVPPSFAIMAVATGIYLLAALAGPRPRPG